MQSGSFRKYFVEDVIEACSAKGLLIKKYPHKENLTDYQHAPISLFQTPYPASTYDKIYQFQKPMGLLVSALTSRPQKINALLENFLKYDKFLARLVEVSKKYNEYALDPVK